MIFGIILKQSDCKYVTVLMFSKKFRDFQDLPWVRMLKLLFSGGP